MSALALKSTIEIKAPVSAVKQKQSGAKNPSQTDLKFSDQPA
jgi:hypothetical protein